MKSFFKPVLLAGLLATAGFAAFSQVPGADHGCMMGQGGMHEGMQQGRRGNWDPAKMQARMDQHSAVLKAQLKLSPAQEAAWTTFTAAMKPPAGMMANRPDPAEMAKLPTPERIDKMKAIQAQRMTDMNAVMTQHGDATKAFYAVLTPEQQKVFDASTTRYYGAAGHRGGQMGKMGAAAPKKSVAAPKQ